MKTNRISRSMNYLNKKRFPNPKSFNPQFTFLQFKAHSFVKLHYKYSQCSNAYYSKITNEIITKLNTHIVSQFKDYLIYSDNEDYLNKTYTISEIKLNLPQILEYYNSCSVIFPNYVVLYESKYIYKNIQRKQKVIDFQQQQDIEREHRINKSMRYALGFDSLSSASLHSMEQNEEEEEDKVFDTQVLDSLLNQTNTSSIQRLLGLRNDNGNCYNHNKLDSFETIYRNDNSIEMLIDHIEGIEKKSIKRKAALELHTHSSLKQYTSTIKYSNANCTTSMNTKDKSNSISNPNGYGHRGVIICSKISNSKEAINKAHMHQHQYKHQSIVKTNNSGMHYQSPLRAISNETSHSASYHKEKLQISSSSKNNIKYNQHNPKSNTKGAIVTSHVKNALSMPKMDSYMIKLKHPPPITSRDMKKKNNAMIDILASRILKMKSITTTTPTTTQESKQHSKHNKRKSLILGSPFGVGLGSSRIGSLEVNSKLYKLKENQVNNNYPFEKDKDKGKANGRNSIFNINHNNKTSNTNLLSSTKVSMNALSSNSKLIIKKIKDNPISNKVVSISPDKHLLNNWITSLTSTQHIPTRSLLPIHDSLLSNKIQLKGLHHHRCIKKNETRNNCNTERLHNKRPSYQKPKCIKLD